VRRRKDDTGGAQRQEELLRDCIVSPNVFGPMVDGLDEFVVPYQQALEAGQHHVHRYLAGLLSHLNRKNAETIVASVRRCHDVLESLQIRDAPCIAIFSSRQEC
jgi:hypothetical protein